MKRDLQTELEQCRSSPLRKPLMLHGARQVGKSWLVRNFGRSFTHFVEVNLEQRKEAHQLFKGDLDVKKIILDLEFYLQQKIIPGETLLFFDEIQECEEAVKALRYFKEDMPELHVIAAGSLINFTLEKIGLAVGRVQFLYVYPLSFGEFLTASGQDDLRQHIKKEIPHPVLHQKLLEFIKTYFWLGGMPAVVSEWLRDQNPMNCQDLQNEIIDIYRKDFVKYAKKFQLESLEKVFSSIPLQLGKKFKYVTVDPHSRALPLKNALDLLSMAGIAQTVYHSGAQGLPLGAMRDDHFFKVFFFDIGLAQRMLGLDLSAWVTEPIAVNHLGAICEQFVAQEYIAYTSKKSPPELYYWHRQEKQSNAEVDFVFLKQNKIIPAEVKAGSKGQLRSLQIFLETHPNSPYGLKISEAEFNLNPTLQAIPFYGIEAWLSK